MAELRLESGKRGGRSPVYLVAMILVFLILYSEITWGEIYTGWKKIPDGWVYREAENEDFIRDKWLREGQEWYHFDFQGIMDIGWKRIDGHWYFFNPEETGGQGRMLTGWQWINGSCYYLEPEDRGSQDGKYPFGAMRTGGVTPDGYQVNLQGAWTDQTGNAVYIAGKGITLKSERGDKKAPGNGSHTSRGAGGGWGNPGSIYEEERHEWQDPGNISDVLGSHEDEGENEPDGEDGKCGDRESPLEGDTGDHMDDSPELIATPSEAARVHWKIYFIEKGSPQKEIFQAQEGESEEGTKVFVDFPEVFLGRDGCAYRAITESPMEFYANGNGNQKLYVEYEREQGDCGNVDPDGEARERLKHWLSLAAQAEREITGKLPEGQQIITYSSQESSERIKNLVSMTEEPDRHVIYLVAANHVPSPLTIGQMSAWNVNITWQEEDELVLDETAYVIIRASFTRVFPQTDCSHDWEITNQVVKSCLQGGSMTVACGRCGKEETVMLPPSGHRDDNQDGICQVCYEKVTGDEKCRAIFYREGDVQIRKLGNRLYLFRCVDEDYSDGKGNYKSRALFLCDTVIRSDIDSTAGEKKELPFGQNNNYKTSRIRSWLLENGQEDFYGSSPCFIGLGTSCEGATEAGAYEQLDDTGLRYRETPFQLMEDRVFILSVEEALRYKEYLWKFNGYEENNPLTQYSAYSRGYYLRTPRYDGDGGRFRYGKEIYVVDLVNGNIHTVQTDAASIGFRPAYTLEQA